MDMQRIDANRKWQEQVKLKNDLAQHKADLARFNATQKSAQIQKQQEFEAEQNQLDRESREKINATNQAAQTQRAQMANETSLKKSATSATKGVRGKQLGFSDGKGNHVSIYENVWKPSMQQVFDAILEDGVAELPVKQKYEGSTSSQKEDFVKQNWAKSPKARAIMMALSQIDPAVMQNEVQEEVEEWTPESEEIEEWTPDKK